MNEEMENKLDRLLTELPKSKYDLDAWLAEDETAVFDRMVNERHRHKRLRWIATAACLLILIGVGVTIKHLSRPTGTEPMVSERHVQPLPSPQEKEITACTDAPKVETNVTAQPQRQKAAKKNNIVKTHLPPPTSHLSTLLDTLGESIWQRKENVILAVQMLNDCEEAIQRGEQTVRNTIIEATYHALPQPENVILVTNEAGDYEVIDSKRIIDI